MVDSSTSSPAGGNIDSSSSFILIHHTYSDMINKSCIPIHTEDLKHQDWSERERDIIME
jgi:hypothetical protein